METTTVQAKKAGMVEITVEPEEVEHITITVLQVEQAQQVQLESFGAVVDHSLTTRQTYKIPI
jgi:ribosomal protein L3